MSARLRSPPHIPTPANAIAARSHLLCSLCLLAMPFVVFPPPSHKLHLGSPRGGDGTRSLRERADRRTGTSLPSSARVRQATCPSNVLPYLVTRIGPGLPASLSSQPKQSLLTGREVRAAKRRRPLHLEGGQHAPHVGGPISSKSRYARQDAALPVFAARAWSRCLSRVADHAGRVACHAPARAHPCRGW